LVIYSLPVLILKLFLPAANVPNGGTSNIGTLIVQGFGFTTLQTALMQIPYGVTIALTIFFAIWLNGVAPKNSRTILMALLTVPAVAGFASEYALIQLMTTSD
jgi:nitrate/nitrite transporter NarK